MAAGSTKRWSVYPSLYEGFGLPVLDALRHGTPVLASEHSSLCELDHPGVHYFDPYDAATVDSAWRSFSASPSLVTPSVILDTLYRWEAVARTVLDLSELYRSKIIRSSRAA